MSSDIVIHVENVSKCYYIFDQPSDRLKQFIYPKFQRILGQLPTNYYKEFWALKDISLEIRKGETIGIVGRNGSGKSTLLQIICGTLYPTSGTIQTQGRIAALLELGSGFNPEFTGRENTYLNGAVLGLSKEEIDLRFDDIAAFADIGDFIEQPVKTYSSGMMVRLAFAVIAHVNADILIIDEALAVGDSFFSQKCMRFLRNFMDLGTTLFVSHDSAAVKNLCTRAIWLSRGTSIMSGTPEKICNHYLQQSLQETYGNNYSLGNLQKDHDNEAHNVSIEKSRDPIINYGTKAIIQDNLSLATGWKTDTAEVIAITIDKLNNNPSLEFAGGEKVRVTIRAKAYDQLNNPILGFILKDRLGQELFGENTIPVTHQKECIVNAGHEFEAVFIFRLPILQNGEYMMMVSLAEGDTLNHIHHHYMHDAFLLKVHSSQVKFGIVGVSFDHVSLTINGNATYSLGDQI